MNLPLRVRVSAEALAQIEQVAEWWLSNRPLAPGAVREDVAEMLNVVSRQPGLGTAAKRHRIKGLRRVTLERLSNYLYYRVSNDVLEVLAFWHTNRGKPPRISIK